VIAAFLEDGPRLLADARTALAQQEAKGLRLAAHGLRGSLGHFGAAEATAAAATLEERARHADLTGAAPALDQLEQAIGRLVPALIDLAAHPAS
jgi:HPt (histidine-containing phosphotransfer) domain-containing protein